MLRKTEFLYAYFVYNNEKNGISFNRIKRALEGIELHIDDTNNNKYVPLYNLIRYGLIEFLNRNTYGLSPSILIHGDKYSLGINLPKIADESVVESFLGLKVLNNSMLQIDNELIQPFDFKNAIRTIPNIQNIIRNSFDEWPAGFQEGTSIECLSANGWKPSKKKEGTFFRVSFGSNQSLSIYIVKLSGNKYFQFERTEFEKFNLAMMMHSINEFVQIKNLEYDTTRQILRTQAFGFPLILERLLFINHILETGTISLTQEYYLATADFKFINRILHYKINKL